MWLMRLDKRLLKHPLTQGLIARVLSSYIRLVYSTSRKFFVYDNLARPYMNGDRNAIFAFWHGRMMLCPTVCPRGRQMRVLISLHRDGKLISTVISHFNQLTVSGSSSKGGSEAVKEMLTALANGDNISITPDGPRGPSQKAAMGIVTVARLSQKPVLPVTYYSDHAKHLRSWDRFMLALPFGRIVFFVGAPITLNGDDDEASRLALENTMNALQENANNYFSAGAAP